MSYWTWPFRLRVHFLMSHFRAICMTLTAPDKQILDPQCVNTPSSLQGGCATVLCQPLDVMKTRLMNSKGEYGVSMGLCRRNNSLRNASAVVTCNPEVFHLTACVV